MNDWDKLDAQYSGGKAAPTTANPWDALDAAYKKPQATMPEPKKVAKVEELPKRDATAGDRVQAGMAGVNRGFFADLAGLPVDTVASGLDLLKAGVGAAYTATTGKPAHDVLLPYDRSQIPLTSEWLAKKYNDVGIGGAINNPNPDDSVSRVLHSGGRAVGGSIVPIRSLPISAGRQALNAGAAAASGLSAGTAAEMTDDPYMIALAGMLPTAAGRTAAAGTRAAVRGGEAGRKAMAQRITDLKNGGIETPSVGLASGNKFFQGLENIASNTPGAVGMYDTAREGVIGGMKRKTTELADSISPVRGALESGLSIQNDIAGSFRDRFRNAQTRLYDKVDSHIPANTKVPVKNTADTLGLLTAGIDGAPNIGDRFVNGRISDINDALKLDTGLSLRQGSRAASNSLPGSPAIPGDAGRGPITVSRAIDPRAAVPGEGNRAGVPMNSQNTPRKQATDAPAPMRTINITIPAVPASPGVPARPSTTVSRTINPHASVAGEGAWKPADLPQLPYKAVAKLRTQVGNELESNSLVSDVPRSQWKQLYGSLSQDIGGAAANAGPQATQAWERANNYTKKGITRLEDLQTISGKATPEAAHTTLANSLNAGPTAFERVRNSVTVPTRQKFASTVVDDMGAATPGQQGASGTDWSPRTFLTNYNKMDPTARTAMFKRLPGGEAHAERLADIAKAADMVASSNKVWANPSGTAAATASRATFLALVPGTWYNPVAGAAVAGGLALNAATSKALLLNPKFVNWLAQAPKVKPENMQAHIQRLIINTRAAHDPEMEKNVATYLDSLKQSQDENED